jgi:predicted ATPase
LLDQALIDAERSGLQMWTPELYRRKGVLLMQISSGNREEAKVCFDRAIAVATEQGALALLLRALADKLRIASERERPAAREALASLCSRLQEGDEYADVVKARWLLEVSGHRDT